MSSDEIETPMQTRPGAGPISTSIYMTLYLLTVLKIAPSYMKSRPAYKLKTYIIIYNTYQIAACVYLLYKSSVSNLPVLRFWKCYDMVPGTTDSEVFYYIAYITYWVRVTELTETVVFILRKKHRQVSFLHVFHHCSTLLMVYFFNNVYKSSAAIFPLCLNSFVHLIMYTYYLMAAALPKSIVATLTPIKKSITIIQMIQFTMALGQVGVALTIGCHIPKGVLSSYIFMIAVIFYMFYDFYKKNYFEKKTAAVEKSKMEADKLNNNLIQTN